MTQGFYTAISGISAGQQKIDVVSDNIANINTIAFKESLINFSDVFSRTLTMGSGPTKSLGGINPMQIGLGCKTASITKNFTAGPPQSTGIESDLYLDGDGFFCVKGPSNEILYTRAGNFTVDADGCLVNSAGYNVLGTDSSYSIEGPTTPIKIPSMLTMETKGNYKTGGDAFYLKDFVDMNALSFQKSESPAETDFIIKIKHGVDGDVLEVPVNIYDCENIQQICSACNKAIDAKLNEGVADPADWVRGGIKVQPTGAPSNPDGTLQIVIDKTFDNPTGATTDIKRLSSVELVSKSSDFWDETKLTKVAGIDSTPLDPNDGTITYTSKILDYVAELGPADNVTSACSRSSYKIMANGAIKAYYSNGDSLTVETNPDNKNVQLLYEKADGTKIRSKDITVNTNIIEPGNLQIQLAKVINPNGLTSQGNNVFKMGENAGEVLYTIASENGTKITSGSYEGSNVDLTKQFAELIVAQRGVEANSRTFTTISNVLQTLIQMGR